MKKIKNLIWVVIFLVSFVIFIPLILILNNNDSNFSTLVVQQQKNLQNKNLNYGETFFQKKILPNSSTFIQKSILNPIDGKNLFPLFLIEKKHLINEEFIKDIKKKIWEKKINFSFQESKEKLEKILKIFNKEIFEETLAKKNNKNYGINFLKNQQNKEITISVYEIKNFNEKDNDLINDFINNLKIKKDLVKNNNQNFIDVFAMEQFLSSIAFQKYYHLGNATEWNTLAQKFGGLKAIHNKKEFDEYIDKITNNQKLKKELKNIRFQGKESKYYSRSAYVFKNFIKNKIMFSIVPIVDFEEGKLKLYFKFYKLKSELDNNSTIQLNTKDEINNFKIVKIITSDNLYFDLKHHKNNSLLNNFTKEETRNIIKNFIVELEKIYSSYALKLGLEIIGGKLLSLIDPLDKIFFIFSKRKNMFSIEKQKIFNNDIYDKISQEFLENKLINRSQNLKFMKEFDFKNSEWETISFFTNLHGDNGQFNLFNLITSIIGISNVIIKEMNTIFGDTKEYKQFNLMNNLIEWFKKEKLISSKQAKSIPNIIKNENIEDFKIIIKNIILNISKKNIILKETDLKLFTFIGKLHNLNEKQSKLFYNNFFNKKIIKNILIFLTNSNDINEHRKFLNTLFNLEDKINFFSGNLKNIFYNNFFSIKTNINKIQQSEILNFILSIFQKNDLIPSFFFLFTNVQNIDVDSPLLNLFEKYKNESISYGQKFLNILAKLKNNKNDELLQGSILENAKEKEKDLVIILDILKKCLPEFKDLNEDKLISVISKIILQQNYNFDSTTDLIDYFQNIFNNLFEKIEKLNQNNNSEIIKKILLFFKENDLIPSYINDFLFNDIEKTIKKLNLLTIKNDPKNKNFFDNLILLFKKIHTKKTDILTREDLNFLKNIIFQKIYSINEKNIDTNINIISQIISSKNSLDIHHLLKENEEKNLNELDVENIIFDNKLNVFIKYKDSNQDININQEATVKIIFKKNNISISEKEIKLISNEKNISNQDKILDLIFKFWKNGFFSFSNEDIGFIFKNFNFNIDSINSDLNLKNIKFEDFFTIINYFETFKKNFAILQNFNFAPIKQLKKIFYGELQTRNEVNTFIDILFVNQSLNIKNILKNFLNQILFIDNYSLFGFENNELAIIKKILKNGFVELDVNEIKIFINLFLEFEVLQKEGKTIYQFENFWINNLFNLFNDNFKNTLGIILKNIKIETQKNISNSNSFSSLIFNLFHDKISEIKEKSIVLFIKIIFDSMPEFKNLNLSNNFYNEMGKNINNILKFGIKKINLVEFIMNIIKNKILI